MSELFVTLGNHLRDKRMQAGLSQKEVADKLGYSSSQFVSNCERGLCALPLNKLRVLVDLYKMSADELMNIILVEQKKALKKALSAKSKGKKRA